ncbi:hypothetical protein TNCV_1611781 [Trichonephila clavipes]|nr:hypothetical protein TNCV_1611781 [Trichonephila clavipes]
MERIPLPPQIAFLPCTSQSQDKLKARLPIGRENPGHWSTESLTMILGRFHDPANLSNPEIKTSSEIRSSDGNANIIYLLINLTHQIVLNLRFLSNYSSELVITILLLGKISSYLVSTQYGSAPQSFYRCGPVNVR